MIAGRSISSANTSGVHLKDITTLWPAPSTTTAYILPPILNTRSSPHKICSVVCGSTRQCARTQSTFITALGSWPICRALNVGLPDLDFENAHRNRGVGQAARHLGVKILGDVFSRGILHIEGRNLIQILMIQAGHHLAHQVLYVDEIDQQAGVIQTLPRDDNLHLEVVAVQVLAAAFVVAERVGRRESLFYSNFKHV